MGQQLEKVTANNRVENRIAERHAAHVDGSAMGVRLGKTAPGPVLRARSHVRGKVEAEGLSARVRLHQALEHLSRPGGQFKDVHSITNARVAHGAGVGSGMKK